MFSNLKAHWRSLHWLARTVVVVIVLWLVLTVLSLVVGTGSWGQAQAATPHPSKAWLERSTITGFFKKEESSVHVATVADGAHEISTQWKDSKSFTNVFGQELIWLKMTVNLRYSPSQHRITYAPAAQVTAGITTLGSLGQWKVESLQSNPGQYYTYKGHRDGGYLWWSVLTTTRCLPAPLVGCVQVGTATETIEIRAHYDGTASLY